MGMDNYTTHKEWRPKMADIRAYIKIFIRNGVNVSMEDLEAKQRGNSTTLLKYLLMKKYHNENKVAFRAISKGFETPQIRYCHVLKSLDSLSRLEIYKPIFNDLKTK